MKIIAFSLAAAVLPAPCLAQLQATTRWAAGDVVKNDRVLLGEGGGRFLEVEDSLSMSIGMMEGEYMGKSSKGMGKGMGKSGKYRSKGEKMEDMMDYGCSIDAMVGSFAGQAYLYSTMAGGYVSGETSEMVVTFARPEVAAGGTRRLDGHLTGKADKDGGHDGPEGKGGKGPVMMGKGDKGGGAAMPTGPAGVVTSRVCFGGMAYGAGVAIQTGVESDNGVIPFTMSQVLGPDDDRYNAWTANGEYYCDSNEMYMGGMTMFSGDAFPFTAPFMNYPNMMVADDGCPVGEMGHGGAKADKMGGKSDKMGSKGMKGDKSGKAMDHNPPTPTPPTYIPTTYMPTYIPTYSPTA